MQRIRQRRKMKHPMKGGLVLRVRPMMGQKRGRGVTLDDLEAKLVASIVSSQQGHASGKAETFPVAQWQ